MRKIFRHTFSLVCFLIAFGMTLFWFHKFWKDDDLCIFDYVPYQTAFDIPDPMASICFYKPFIESKLEAHNTSQDEYVKFLKGKVSDTRLETIEFEDVTINPSLFYLGDNLQWRNGTYQAGDYPNHVNNLPYVTFSGFWYGTPIKCYGLGLPDKKIKYGYFALNVNVFENGTYQTSDPNYCAKERAMIVFHIAHQIVLSSGTLKEVCLQNVINTEQAVDFTINNLEIIKRRDKRNDPCVRNYQDYDRTVVNTRIDRLGCRPRYLQPSRNTTICKTMETLKEAMVVSNVDFVADDAIQPCLSIGDIRVSQGTAYNPGQMSKGPDATWLSMTPPKKIRMIQQVKDVSIQTVIGNAGGYIGLFLGKCYFAANVVFVLKYDKG